MGRTLGAAYDRTHNNFDALRFVLATAVLWSHAYSLVGELDPLLAFSGRQMSFGAVGVEGFFVLSGFLVSQSWLGTGDVRRFVEKRSRRVLPGLLVAMAVGVFAIGPLVTTQAPGAYFTAARTWLHFPGLFAHAWLEIPGVFPHNLFRNHMNGSLWSLRYEIGCYAMTVLLGALGRRAWRPAVVTTALGAVVLNALVHRAGAHPPTWASWGSTLVACYATGMALYALRDRVPYHAGVAAFALLAFVAAARSSGLVAVAPIAGGYVLVWIACAAALPLQGFGRHGDFSYGLYLYAFPVQQVLLHVFGAKLAVGPFAAAAFALTLPLAMLSWHLIEAPALRRVRAVPEAGAAVLRAAGVRAPGGA